MKMKRMTAVMLAGILMTSFALTGCGKKEVDPDAVVATFNDKEISLGLANFMAQYNAVTYDSYYSSYFGADMWTKDFSGQGKTLEDNVKEQVMDSIETGYTLEEHLGDYGIEISDDDMKAVKDAAAKFMDDNTQPALQRMTATEENVAEMLRLDTIQSKMQKAIEAEVDTEVSDEEAAQRTFSYYKVTLPETTAENSTEATEAVEETTEEKAADLKAYAEQVAASAVSDFDGIADTYGLTVSTESYGTDEDQFDATVIEKANQMKAGDISEAIQGKDGQYYVIRLDSEFDEKATENKKDEIVSQRKSDHFKEVCDGYKKDVKWKVNDDVWDTVTFAGNTYTMSSNKTDTEAASTTETAVDNNTSVDTEAVNETENALLVQ